MCMLVCIVIVKQKTAYEMRISDWSSDVCSSDLTASLAQSALRHRCPGSRAPWRARRGPTVIALLIVAGLIVLNAFFALSEMALVTSRKIRLKQMSETSRGARKALALAEQPDNLLSTVQVGITLIGVLTGLVGGDAIGLVITGWLQDVLPAAGEYARPI